jgi:hypothetical protein
MENSRMEWVVSNIHTNASNVSPALVHVLHTDAYSLAANSQLNGHPLLKYVDCWMKSSFFTCTIT